MPCYSRRRTPQQTQAMRDREVKASVNRLKQRLATGNVRVIVGPQGAVALVGWKDRDDVTDVCAIRKLMSEGSPELRKALARAEAVSGNKVNKQTIASGVHSHDGGKTWGKD